MEPGDGIYECSPAMMPKEIWLDADSTEAGFYDGNYLVLPLKAITGPRLATCSIAGDAVIC